MPIEHRDVGASVLDMRDGQRVALSARPLLFRCEVEHGRLVATHVAGAVEEATGYPPSWFLRGDVTLCDLIHQESVTEHLGQDGSDAVTLWTRDGRARAFLMEQIVLRRDAEGRPLELVATLVDITERAETEAVLTLHQRVLELIAAGTELTVVLNQICNCVETFFPGITACIMGVGDDDLLHVLAAPTLDDEAIALVDGFPIGPRAGNCGTAVYEQRQVITPNTLEDPGWDGNRHFARRFGIISKWSTPIFSPEREVLGTLGLSRAKVGHPSPVEQRIMEAATYLAGIAMDRERHERQHKVFERQLRAIFEASPDVIFMKDARCR
ncbi:MAG: GAF domain-containing protein, partial [Phycisphaerales bacterium]|nr:GAF domain-containing protein [Phycisphaerales bacterium]